jgi:hypothetical protein
MLQVATFLVPTEQEKANEFLKTHKPAGEIHFNTNMIVIFWDDWEYPASYQITDLRELIQSNQNATFQMEVALDVMKHDLADLKPGTKNWQDLSSAISDTENKIAIQGIKRAFAEKRIEEIKKANGIE